MLMEARFACFFAAVRGASGNFLHARRGLCAIFHRAESSARLPYSATHLVIPQGAPGAFLVRIKLVGVLLTGGSDTGKAVAHALMQLD